MRKKLRKPIQQQRLFFAGGADTSNMPTTVLADEDFTDGSVSVLYMMVKAGIIKNQTERADAL